MRRRVPFGTPVAASVPVPSTEDTVAFLATCSTAQAAPVLALSRILLFTGMLLCLLGLYLMRSSGEPTSADVATSNQRTHEHKCTEELPRRQGFARALPEVWRVTQALQPRPIWRP